MKMLEPKYSIPSRLHFSQSGIPKLYNETTANVTKLLRAAEYAAITIDVLMSRMVQSSITMTANVITCEWGMQDIVLQTWLLFESNAWANIADVSESFCVEWGLLRENHSITIVIDNAQNMEVAVKDTRLSPHIKCFVHNSALFSTSLPHSNCRAFSKARFAWGCTT